MKGFAQTNVLGEAPDPRRYYGHPGLPAYYTNIKRLIIPVWDREIHRLSIILSGNNVHFIAVVFDMFRI
jgi:hypothetical protein